MTPQRARTIDDLKAKQELVFTVNPVLQRRLEQTTSGLVGSTKKMIASQIEENKQILCDFLHEITYKENLSDGSKDAYIKALCYLLRDVGTAKSLKKLAAQDVELYLQSHQKPKYQDPKQRWISTHNMRAVTSIKFFRWLYYPDLPAKNRPKPDIIKNVVAYQKPEATNVEAKDLWTA